MSLMKKKAFRSNSFLLHIVATPRIQILPCYFRQTKWRFQYFWDWWEEIHHCYYEWLRLFNFSFVTFLIAYTFSWNVQWKRKSLKISERNLRHELSLDTRCIFYIKHKRKFRSCSDSSNLRFHFSFFIFVLNKQNVAVAKIQLLRFFLILWIFFK